MICPNCGEFSEYLARNRCNPDSEADSEWTQCPNCEECINYYDWLYPTDDEQNEAKIS